MNPRLSLDIYEAFTYDGVFIGMTYKAETWSIADRQILIL